MNSLQLAAMDLGVACAAAEAALPAEHYAMAQDLAVRCAEKDGAGCLTEQGMIEAAAFLRGWRAAHVEVPR